MTADPNAVERRRDPQDVPSEIVEAARQKFLRYGVNRTTMADIARAVGMPRQAMYEFVSSRSDVVDAVLLQRIREIADDLKPLAGEGISFTEAFIETSVAAIQRARSDEELMNIFNTGPSDRVQDVVTGPYPQVHEIVVNLLGPILERGAEAGLLRADKSRDELIDWIRVVYLILINQSESRSYDERELVADFLLPSIMFCPSDRHPIPPAPRRQKAPARRRADKHSDSGSD